MDIISFIIIAIRNKELRNKLNDSYNNMGDTIAFCNHNFPKLLKDGVIGSVIGQYISDLIFNVFVYEKTNLMSVITNVSKPPAYYAATTSGMLNGITEPYIDDITSVGMRNVAYAWTNNYFSIQFSEEDIVDTLDVENLVQDTIAVIIIVWAFNIHARHDFINHKMEKYGLPHIYDDAPDIFTSALIIVVTNLYAYYKLQRDHPELLGIDRSVDIIE